MTKKGILAYTCYYAENDSSQSSSSQSSSCNQTIEGDADIALYQSLNPRNPLVNVVRLCACLLTPPAGCQGAALDVVRGRHLHSNLSDNHSITAAGYEGEGVIISDTLVRCMHVDCETLTVFMACIDSKPLKFIIVAMDLIVDMCSYE